MKGYVADIEKLTTENTDFRRVLYTGKHLQLVLMALKANEEIGSEVHDTHDQFFRVEEGAGKVLIDGVETSIKDDDVVIVPAGARRAGEMLITRSSGSCTAWPRPPSPARS